MGTGPQDRRRPGTQALRREPDSSQRCSQALTQVCWTAGFHPVRSIVWPHVSRTRQASRSRSDGRLPVKVLVLGADGMLGHELVRALLTGGHDVAAGVRRCPSAATGAELAGARIIGGLDARLHETVLASLAEVEPETVINAIGLVKQRPEAQDPFESIRVNSVFPHGLRVMCLAAGARLIHFSTDCVFSGHKGGYTEDDLPDPPDLYGRSKLLGEVTGPKCLTLRTSILGLELFRKDSLVEWFLRQKSARGWTRAIYSGLTTMELSRLVVRLLEGPGNPEGLWHVGSDPISKYQLLILLRNALGRDVEVAPDDSVVLDRSLNSDRFRIEFDYWPPSWAEMASELADAITRRELKAGA